MVYRENSKDGNREHALFLSFGTPRGTTHRNGASPSSSAVVRRSCSYVPIFSFRLNNEEKDSNRLSKRIYTRVKGFFVFRNTGGQYERIKN